MELGKIVLSVVVVFGCGRCTGVVFLVNGFFSDVFVVLLRGIFDCDEAKTSDIKMTMVKMS